MFPCKYRFCTGKFSTKTNLKEHEFELHGEVPSVLKKCCEVFKRNDKRHHSRSHHTSCSPFTYLHERLSSIHVTLSDREKSLLVVEKVLNEIGKTFSYHDSIFGQTFRKSGSYSTDTKIFEADEFDFDIPVKYSLEELHIRRRGEVYYGYTQKQQTLSLNVPMYVTHTRDYEGIPNGYVEVKANTGTKILPRKIQEELYQDLKCAITRLKFISLDRKAHGPALTLTITRPESHEINVDVVPSISTNQISLVDFNWPRIQTKKVLSNRLINAIHAVGLHLIPKNVLFWYVSVSKAGNTLMNGLDVEDSGCRRYCHKLLKADFHGWKEQSANGLPGISTMLFKHQLFWMNEENPHKDWSKDCLHERYIDRLDDLILRLRNGSLYNYFRDVENVLKEKDQQVLNQVANCAERRRRELLKLC